MSDKTKKIYIAVLTIATVAAILFGTFYHVLNAFYHWRDFLGKPVAHIGKHDAESEFENEFDNVSAIHIDCAMTKVVIDDGDTFSVSYEGSEKMRPTVTCNDDGTLSIVQKSTRNANLKDNDNELTITLKEDSKLSDLNIDLAMGDIKIDSINASAVTINAAMGNVRGEDVNADSFDLDAAMGNIELYDAKFNDLDADAAMGNITVECENDIAHFDVDASADLGTVKVNGENVAGKGKYNTSATAERYGKISANCDLGNITIY